MLIFEETEHKYLYYAIGKKIYYKYHLPTVRLTKGSLTIVLDLVAKFKVLTVSE